MKTIDFWLMSYPKDYPWLPHLWASITKYAKGFRRCVLLVEEQDRPPIDLPAYVVIKRCRNYRGTEIPGYFGQCIEGLRAHTYSDADVIWFLESDCIFTRPIDLQADPHWPIDRPNLLYDSWERVGEAQCWRDSTRAAVGFDPPAETMRCHPFIYPRWFVREVWEGCGKENALRDVVRSLGKLSQFNVFGAWGMVRAPRAFRLVDVAREVPRHCMRQFWSHAGVDDPAVRADLGRMGLL